MRYFIRISAVDPLNPPSMLRLQRFVCESNTKEHLMMNIMICIDDMVKQSHIITNMCWVDKQRIEITMQYPWRRSTETWMIDVMPLGNHVRSINMIHEMPISTEHGYMYYTHHRANVS